MKAFQKAAKADILIVGGKVIGRLPKKPKIKKNPKSELSQFWDNNPELYEYFGTKESFYTWHGFHKFELKDEFDKTLIIALRKRLNRRKHYNK